ncbi:hypothetical protein GCM10009780_74890 [Actinomadura alba]
MIKPLTWDFTGRPSAAHTKPKHAGTTSGGTCASRSSRSLYKGRAANKFGILTGQIVAIDTPQMRLSPRNCRKPGSNPIRPYLKESRRGDPPTCRDGAVRRTQARCNARGKR